MLEGRRLFALPALPDDPLSGIQPDEVPRRETGQDPKGYSKAALANEAVVFRTSNRHGSVLARFAIQCDAHIRFLQRAVVPATDPVVGSDVEVAGGFNAGHDPVMRDVIAIEEAGFADIEYKKIMQEGPGIILAINRPHIFGVAMMG